MNKVNFLGDQPLSGAAKRAFEPVIQQMANDFEVDIDFIICHGKRENIPVEMDFEKFYIFVNMFPDCLTTRGSNIKKLVIGEKEFDVKGGQSDIFLIEMEASKIPSSVSVIKDSRDREIAVVHDASLYFLSDFCHCSCQEGLDKAIAVYKYVINEATKTPDLIKALKAGPEEKGRRSLQIALERQFKERLKKEQLQLESANKLYEEYMSNIVKAQRKVLSTEKILVAIQENMNAIPEAMSKKWDSTKKLEKSSMYEKIAFQKSCVKGYTTPVYIKHAGKTYKVGKFEVTLGFDGSVKIKSLWPERGVPQDHPHVSTENPCWGNLSGELPKRIAESEFDVAFVEIHTFLESYDPGNPYATIDRWPVLTKEELASIKA
jgi:hypothetical protein